MEIKTFKHNDWVKIWDGGWSFLSCSHFGDEYTKEIIFGKRPFQSQSIIFSSKGRSSGWMKQSDRDILGKHLSNKIKNKKSAEIISTELIFQAKNFLQFISKNENTVANQKLYTEFWKRLCVYYKAHINVKYVVDYLNPTDLKRYLPILQKARLVAEPVLNRTEEFMQSFAKLMAKKIGLEQKLILCLTKSEIEDFLKSNILPKKSILKKRFEGSVILSDRKTSTVFSGEKFKKTEQLVHTTTYQKEIRGVTAYPGKANGTARVILDTKKIKIFNIGDILITGATRPEFLPLMSKAAAFVTDAGGILSHAAITAREMKKPCIIGAKIATKIFRDGDIIEVDANTGIVKNLNNKINLKNYGHK